MVNLKNERKLYLVSTPIGNLSDITLRALEKLKSVDGIIAEDSRRTKKLLSAHEIETPIVKTYYQGAEDRADQIVDTIKKGRNLALVSDAGTPLISDPGYKLVRLAIDKGVRVITIPGPSAVTTALPASGQPTDSFIFDGMLPKKKNKKENYLYSLKNEKRTVIVYESPHRIEGTLEKISSILPQREMSLCRELTKKHEEIIRGTAKEILKSKRNKNGFRGEITLIIRGASEKEIEENKKQRYSDISIKDQYEILTTVKGMKRKEAMKKIAELRGISKREVFDRLAD